MSRCALRERSDDRHGVDSRRRFEIRTDRAKIFDLFQVVASVVELNSSRGKGENETELKRIDAIVSRTKCMHVFYCREEIEFKFCRH